ncbi:MAG TPA: outer membrane lipoprotein carrier protein LolA [Bacillaceae bacterium]|nr:outer membrane lipoprotein carrier protein LolA [Paenibacillus bovis]HLU22910.1 outer membrane lipoprotein carrier protein LolA [Bacillaceae bacterium]
MRKELWLVIALIAVIAILSACGTKSQEDVTKDLQEKAEELKGYKATAKMTLAVGNEPHSYDIDIWHNKPGDYRVHLKNEKKNQSQMILRNKTGVYVLTPALNKSYKFQSDWPKNSSQAYLYESLVADILADSEAKFKATKEHYVFETKTRYQNKNMLPNQEITFKKDTLEPVSVKVMDANQNPVVTVEFSKMEFNPKFDKNSFDTNNSMTSAQLDVEVIGDNGDSEFSVQYSMADIPGITLVEEKVVNTENGKRALLSYAGEDKSFTIIQEKVDVIPATSMETVNVNGEMVDLGFTIGAMTDKTISWSDNGVEFLLVSNDLTPEEMIMVAKSVQGGVVK